MQQEAPEVIAPDLSHILQSVSGDVVPFTRLLEQLNLTVPFAQAVVVSSLPRGGLQIVQPPNLPEVLKRSYQRDFHRSDRLTWQALAKDSAVRASDAWNNADDDSLNVLNQFFSANDFTHAAAAPLAMPVLSGYGGAIHLYRDASQGEFSDDELSQLMEFARALDDVIERVRKARFSGRAAPAIIAHSPRIKQFIFDSQLNSVLRDSDVQSLDGGLREQLFDDAKKRFSHVNGEAVLADRVGLPDSHGDLWNFRVVLHRDYPAISHGPVVFFCLEPACEDWSVVRPTDFQADSELARLIPALKFMQQEFHRSPSLVETAKTVHLSPFHFHRRFSELLGITPKHFLLDCQIQQAKTDLLARQKDLAVIAAECGFAHQSHFTSRFKQATGLTPTRWRRMALDAQRAADAQRN